MVELIWMFSLAILASEEIPKILNKKVSNPWPNVDNLSGVALKEIGLSNAEFNTVLFGLSRCIGILPNLGRDDE